MPKCTNTRQQRAAQLLRRLETGPAFSSPFDGSNFTPETAKNKYKLWVDTWILDELVDLIPELKRKKS